MAAKQQQTGSELTTNNIVSVDQSPSTDIRGGIRFRLIQIAIVLSIPGMLLGCAMLRYGSIRVAIGVVRGHSLIVATPELSAGTRPIGERVLLHLRLWNNSEDKAAILGASSSCTCLTATSLPKQLASATYTEIPIEVRFGPKPGPFRQEITFFSDVPTRTKFRVQVHGLAIK